MRLYVLILCLPSNIFSALLRKVEVQRRVLADCRHIPQGPVSTSAIVGTNGHHLSSAFGRHVGLGVNCACELACSPVHARS